MHQFQSSKHTVEDSTCLNNDPNGEKFALISVSPLWTQRIIIIKLKKRIRKAQAKALYVFAFSLLGRMRFCCKASMNNLRQASFRNNWLELGDTLCLCVCARVNAIVGVIYSGSDEAKCRKGA